MADRTKIEWTDASWNPVRAHALGDHAANRGWHCERVSDGCRNCYAERINRRLGSHQLEDEPHLATVKRMAVAIGPMPVGDMLFPSPNVWLGVSAEDQEAAEERIPEMLATPAAVRFVSLEPLLGPIDLTTVVSQRTDAKINSLVPWRPKRIGGTKIELGPPSPVLDWVITGGESGPNARPMHPEWAREIRDDCAAADVPFFFKQWGEWHADALLNTDTRKCNPPPDMKIGKKRAGRLLDGVEHNGMPR